MERKKIKQRRQKQTGTKTKLSEFHEGFEDLACRTPHGRFFLAHRSSGFVTKVVGEAPKAVPYRSEKNAFVNNPSLQKKKYLAIGRCDTTSLWNTFLRNFCLCLESASSKRPVSST